MTCIVGVKTTSGVMLGGDTLGVSGYDGTVRADGKVFNLTGQVACGFTSSYRMGQILEHHVTVPPFKRGEDLFAWAVREFVPAVRDAFKEHGYTKVDNNRESSGAFLLAVRDRLFRVEDDFQVAEAADGFDSCGCGQSYALGAIEALRHQPQFKSKPQEVLRGALAIAAKFSIGVGGPFTFAETTA